MIIANPIYDVVFKYLLEDAEIARELLSTILGVNIVELHVKPQETIVNDETSGEIKIFRLDFKAIYILGFNLEGVNVPVLKVSRTYTDAITNEVVVANNEFITKLTHESYTIQVKRLKREQRNKLEEVLEVFSQDNVTKDLHNIEVASDSKNPLVKKIVKRLSKAASDEIIRRTMDAEDMIERLINREAKEQLKEQAEQYEEKLNQKDKEIEELKQMLAKK
jgi:hypothetical protein